MQTIARANRVFPDKDNGLIVDYVGVFRNLEKALAIYGADRTGVGIDSPIRPKDDLVDELNAALADAAEFCETHDIDLDDMEGARGFEFIALQKAAVESLLIDEQTRRRYVSLARLVRKTFKALLPDPAAMAVTHRVAVIRSMASKIESSSESPDIRGVMDSVSESAGPVGGSQGVHHPQCRRGRSVDRPEPAQLRATRPALRCQQAQPQPRRSRRTSSIGSTRRCARTRPVWSWPSGSGG